MNSYSPASDLKISSVPPVGAFYSWRVRACDAANRCSAWSEVSYLNVGRLRDDINGDGYGDLLGWGANDSNLQVFLGSPGFDGVTASGTLDAIPGSMNSRFVGDVNGDGFGDFLVFHGYAPTSGSVPVIFFGGKDIANLASTMLTKDAAGSSANLGAGLPGDWDGDGFADVIVSWSYLVTNSSQLRIHFGGPALSLDADLHIDSPYVTMSPPGINDGGLIGDIDGDGFDDMSLFAVDYAGNASQLSFFTGGKERTVSASLVLRQPFAVTGSLGRAGDLDQDGFDDVVVVNRSTSYGYFRGAGTLVDQNFTTRTSTEVASVVAGVDLDRDGKPEFIINRSSGTAQIFEAASLSPEPGGLASGSCNFVTSSDYDGDGYDDLVAECTSVELNVCLGDGTLAPLCRYATVGKVVR